MSFFKVLFVYLLYKHIVSGFTYTNFFLNRLENCDTHNRSKLYLFLTTKNNKQYVDFDITIWKPFDETVGGVAIIETSLDGRFYTKLFNIREKYMCAAANKYMGEFWYDILRASQLPPGVCPIPKRRYIVRNHYLDFSKISLQTFPFGKLRIVLKAYSNDEPEKLVMCLSVDIENMIN